MFDILLISTTLLCALVAGFLFAFAVVAMPGIGRLGDRAFIKAFKEIDGIIQRNNPFFLVVWAGSVVTLITAAIVGYGQLAESDFWLLAGATAVYLLGVQLPTMVVNVPLNNGLQAHDVDSMDDEALAAARTGFESRWNSSNILRTIVSVVVTIALLMLLVRI